YQFLQHNSSFTTHYLDVSPGMRFPCGLRHGGAVTCAPSYALGRGSARRSSLATTTRDNPFQGSNPSTRRQNHTVLSHTLSAGRLIRLLPKSFPATHHDNAPTLLSWRSRSMRNPCASSISRISDAAKRRLWPMPR